MGIERIQRALLILAFLLAVILLLRFTVDFYIEMPVWLAVPFSLLVLASLLVAALHLYSLILEGRRNDGLSKTTTALLLAAIPLSFLASTLDCSGLAPQGCTPFCTFIKLGWIPLTAFVCAIYFFKRMDWLLAIIAAMSLVTLAPHCVCYNVGNGWWIERLSSSPLCYIWGFVVSLIALGAIKSGRFVAASLLVCAAIIGGALTFFISHHYFHFPW